MPAGVLRLAAADLEVAVLLHEEGLLPLAERPEAGRVARDVVGERAGLEVRGREVVPLPNEVELHRLARHLHAFEAVREGREVVSPETLAAHPLRPVDLLPVELVVPDERPLLSGRQQGGRLAGDGLRLHLHGGARLDVRLDEFGPGAERRERGKANELYLHDAEQFSIFCRIAPPRHAPGAARVHRAPEHPRRQRKSPRREGAPRASGKEIRFSVCAAVRGRP